MDPEVIGKRLRKIRQRIREELDADGTPPARGRSESEGEPTPTLDWNLRLRDEDLGSLASTEDLAEANRRSRITGPVRLTSDVPLLGPLINAVRRAFRPVVQAILDPYLDRQEKFNAHVVRHLNELGARLERRIVRLERLDEELESALREYDVVLRRRHAVLFEVLEEEILDLQAMARDAVRGRDAELQKIREVMVERSEGVDRRFEGVDEAIAGFRRDVENLPSMDAAELQLLRTRLIETLDRLAPTSEEPKAEAVERPEAGEGDGDRLGRLHDWLEDAEYRAFQDRFRGKAEDLRERQREHVERFAAVDGPVVDLGCGSGEFVRLLQEAGFEALGVELNAAEVEACVASGLDVVQADLFTWLEQRAERSLGGTFLAQVIEHLPPSRWEELFRKAAVVLRPGGRLVIETINPESLYAMSRAYVVDPTHVRPAHPELMSFLARRVGFQEVDVELQAEVPAEERIGNIDEQQFGPDPDVAALVRRINDRLARLDRLCFAPQEYTLTATLPRKGEGR